MQKKKKKRREIRGGKNKIYFYTSKSLHKINKLTRLAKSFSDLNYFFGLYITFKTNYIVTA